MERRYVLACGLYAVLSAALAAEPDYRTEIINAVVVPCTGSMTRLARILPEEEAGALYELIIEEVTASVSGLPEAQRRLHYAMITSTCED